MYCKSCGTELHDDSKFCPYCGTATPVAAGPTPRAVAPHSHMAEPQKPRRRKGRTALIVAGIAAVTAGAVVAVLYFTGFWSQSAENQAAENIVAFGSTSAVAVTSETKIVPSQAKDTPFVHYYVRVQEAADASGKSLDVFSYPRLEVRVDSGFCLDDFLDDPTTASLPAGAYKLCVTDDDGNDQALPPLQVAAAADDSSSSGPTNATDGATTSSDGSQASTSDSSGAGASTQSTEGGSPSQSDGSSQGDGTDQDDGTDAQPLIVVPADSPDAPKGDSSGDANTSATITTKQRRYAAFLKVIEDLEAQWGEPTLQVASTGQSGYNAYRCWIEGVSFAQVIDFGDGVERLVVVWRSGTTGSWHDTYSLGDYTGAVYEYDEAADTAKQLFTFDMGYGDGGRIYLSLAYDSDGRPRLTSWMSDENTSETFYGLLADGGGVGELDTLYSGISQSGGGIEYSINGEACDASAYHAARDAYVAEGTASWKLTADGPTDASAADGSSETSGSLWVRSPNECVNTVTDLQSSLAQATSNMGGTRRGRYGAFFAVLQSLEERYGTPGTTTADNVTRAEGLAYAGLIDFGDGQERLVAAYYDTNRAQLTSMEKYFVGVWEYDEESDTAYRVVTSGCSYAQDITTGLSFTRGENGNWYLCISQGGDSQIITYYGLADDGSFGAASVLRLDVDMQANSATYSINGIETDQAGYFAENARYQVGWGTDAAADNDDTWYLVSYERLQGAGHLADESSASAGALIDSLTYATTNSDDAPTKVIGGDTAITDTAATTEAAQTSTHWEGSFSITSDGNTDPSFAISRSGDQVTVTKLSWQDTGNGYVWVPQNIVGTISSEEDFDDNTTVLTLTEDGTLSQYYQDFSLKVLVPKNATSDDATGTWAAVMRATDAGTYYCDGTPLVMWSACYRINSDGSGTGSEASHIGAVDWSAGTNANLDPSYVLDASTIDWADPTSTSYDLDRGREEIGSQLGSHATYLGPLISSGDVTAGEVAISGGQVGDAQEAPESQASQDASLATFRYTNARYGYSIDIPEGFTQTDDAANGAGATFKDSNSNFTISLGASNNALFRSVDTILANISSEHELAYEATGDDWLVISYIRDDEIVYTKEYVGGQTDSGQGCGSINVATFVYPTSERDAGDALVEALVSTFSPGDLSVGH